MMINNVFAARAAAAVPAARTPHAAHAAAPAVAAKHPAAAATDASVGPTVTSPALATWPRTRSRKDPWPSF